MYALVENRGLSEMVAPARAEPQPDQTIGELFSDFQPVSLERTNELARMLSRIDNKYVVNFEEFGSFLKAIRKDFSVLEIGGRREFTYRSCYYDDEFRCYFEHHQGRRQRCKVRTREYVDGGGMKFFEVKLKGPRGRTAKHRVKSDFLVSPQINGKYLEMVRDLYAKQYRKDMPFDLRPALVIGYKRCTMVALRGGERVTVDYLMNFTATGNKVTPVHIGKGFIIIETKSSDGKGIADSALKKSKIRQISRCSKYCIGVNLTGGVAKNNNFRATLKRVRKNIVAHGDEESPALHCSHRNEAVALGVRS